MAGLNKKKVIISIVLFFSFAYFFFWLPLKFDVSFIYGTNIIFLNFSVFETYNLETFNIKYLTLFFLFFYLVYHQQISVINENTSFISMYMNKKVRKKLLLK